MSQQLKFKDYNQSINILTQREIANAIEAVKKERNYVMLLVTEYATLASEYYGIQPNDVFKETRKRAVVDSRNLVFFCAVMIQGIKKSTLQRITGWHYTSVIHCIDDVIKHYSLYDDFHDFMNTIIGKEKMNEYIEQVKSRKRKNLPQL